MLRPLPRPALVLVLLGLTVLFSRCDLPTGGPDFGFETSLRAPLVFDKTFVFLGPSDTGYDALLDTTEASFDVFSVDAGDNTLFIEQELDDFDIGELDGVTRDFDLDPAAIAVSIGDLAQQSFSAAYEERLGIFVLDPGAGGQASGMEEGIPIIPMPGQDETELTLPNFLVPPSVNLLTLSDVELEAVTFTPDALDANGLLLELTNGLDAALTSATSDARPPTVTLLQDDQVLGTATFGYVAPGAAQTVRLDLAGQTLTRSDIAYRVDVGAGGQTDPLRMQPGAVRLGIDLQPMHYGTTTVSNIPVQDNIEIATTTVELASDDVDLAGLVAARGTVRVLLNNTMPIPADITALTVTNLDAVAGYAAGSTVFTTSGQRIPADGVLEIPVSLSQTPIAARVAVTVQATSPGSTSLATLDAASGLRVDLTGDVDVERVIFRPEAETFTQAGTIELDVDDVRFDDGDFVELKGGRLEIADLVNGLDLTLDETVLSVPGLRRAPYGPADSLVLRFAGTSDAPDALTFRRLERQSAPRTVAIDLAGLRIYPQDGALDYNVSATSETSTQLRTLQADQTLGTTVRATGLAVQEVQAIIEPFSVAVTEDVDADGRLDVLDAAEAQVSELDDLRDLSERAIDGLQLRGSAFTLNITTNLTTDAVLYGCILGFDAQDRPVYLSGRGALAVDAADSLVQAFAQGGAPVDAANLFRFVLEGSDDPDRPVTRTIVLDPSTTNVDDFISALPVRLHFVGKAVVQPEGGRARLREPYQLDAGLSASIPLSVEGRFTFADTVDADLSDLADLTDPSQDVTIGGASLELDYTNGLPVAVDARLEVLDAYGDVVVVLPRPERPALRLEAAPVDDDGLATGTSTERTELPVDAEELRQLARGQRIRLALGLATNPDQLARLRADDRLDVALKGRFDVTVQVRD